MESLVGLRAELQRKKQQLQEAAQSARLAPVKLKLKSGGSRGPTEAAVPQNAGVGDRDARDKEQTEQEQQTGDQARAALERKAALYDQLHTGVAVLEDDGLNNSFLVNFQKKIVDRVMESKKQPKGAKKKDGKSSTPDGTDDWVEHVDALGRSRQVRRSELEDMKKTDRYLLGEEEDGEKATLAALSSVATAQTDAEVTALQEQYEQHHYEKRRRLWEEQEQANVNKKDMHYEDVMFDEARTHGVGFVRLSGDAATRREQQDLLRDLHASSESAAREHRAQQRAKDRAMASRLDKIRQRKRLKRGLPMTDSANRLKTPPPSDEDDDAEAAKADTVATEVYTKRPGTRVREWDVGKQVIGKFVEPADKDPNPFGRRNLLGGPSEISQENWLDRQRKRRNDEFAPPELYDKSSKRNSTNRKKLDNNAAEYDEDRLQRQYNNSGKSSSANSEVINNECSDSFTDPFSTNPGKSYETSSVFTDYRKPVSARRGAEFAPPASFDYYGPASKRGGGGRLFESEHKMEAAISKGLKHFKDNA